MNNKLNETAARINIAGQKVVAASKAYERACKTLGERMQAVALQFYRPTQAHLELAEKVVETAASLMGYLTERVTAAASAAEVLEEHFMTEADASGAYTVLEIERAFGPKPKAPRAPKAKATKTAVSN